MLHQWLLIGRHKTGEAPWEGELGAARGWRVGGGLDTSAVPLQGEPAGGVAIRSTAVAILHCCLWDRLGKRGVMHSVQGWSGAAAGQGGAQWLGLPGRVLGLAYRRRRNLRGPLRRCSRSGGDLVHVFDVDPGCHTVPCQGEASWRPAGSASSAPLAFGVSPGCVLGRRVLFHLLLALDNVHEQLLLVRHGAASGPADDAWGWAARRGAAGGGLRLRNLKGGGYLPRDNGLELG
mmetsp:Transcript_2426/g.7005  ORF Transcript_2426/g.7005 Transcript_2426/m.7005 type:complete len:234 (-) Transcript_2426:2476-3177(-)